MIHLDVQGIIDLIQAKAMSIFTLLDEECRMPKATGKDGNPTVDCQGENFSSNPRGPGSPKLRMVSWNLNDLCVLGGEEGHPLLIIWEYDWIPGERFPF